MDSSHSGPGIHSSTVTSRLFDKKYKHLVDWLPAAGRFEVTYCEQGKPPLVVWIFPHCVEWARPLDG
jgi:hypothetical protein